MTVLSGFDRFGNPIPPGTMRMSTQGNDLVRGCLWMAAWTAIRHNPAVRPLDRRLRARGKRGDVALGHCMRKLVHLVFAVWKTNRPFDPAHFAWEGPAKSSGPAPAPAAAAVGGTPAAQEDAVGHKRDVPARTVVTTADSSVGPPPPVKPVSSPRAAARPKVDFAFLRQQLTMRQVLEQLGLWGQLRGQGAQRRGPCPVHSHPGDPRRRPPSERRWSEQALNALPLQSSRRL